MRKKKSEMSSAAVVVSALRTKMLTQIVIIVLSVHVFTLSIGIDMSEQTIYTQIRCPILPCLICILTVWHSSGSF